MCTDEAYPGHEVSVESCSAVLLISFGDFIWHKAVLDLVEGLYQPASS